MDVSFTEYALLRMKQRSIAPREVVSLLVHCQPTRDLTMPDREASDEMIARGCTDGLLQVRYLAQGSRLVVINTLRRDQRELIH